MPKINIKVDPDLCIGAASCVTVDSNAFQLNQENKAEILDHGQVKGAPTYERQIEVAEEEKENILLAAQSCPVAAIFIFDEDGRQIYPSK